ncbi:MAG: three-Cys-motif partner protein TcmP, partial [Tepidiformaceae bacterium]
MPKKGERRPPQEFIADIARTDDGIRPFRPARAHSRDKLGILASYLPSYAKACTKAGAFYFVDALAGAGLYRITDTDEWLLASTLVALEVSNPACSNTLAVEIDSCRAQALRSRAAAYGDRTTVVTGDVNLVLKAALAEQIPRVGPMFAFVDPEGAEVHWSTIRWISEHRSGTKKSEILVLYSTSGVPRMLPISSDIALHNEMSLNLLFPPTFNWQPVREARQSGSLSPAAAVGEYLNGYERGFLELGYKHVLRRPIERAGSGQVVYHLIFATDDDTGKRIMEDVFKSMHPNRAQLPL